jgi:hypothetical protein
MFISLEYKDVWFLEIVGGMMQGPLWERTHWSSARSYSLQALTVFVSAIHSLHLSSSSYKKP